MMELVRGHEEKINFARMMYLLSRLEPTEEGPKKEKLQTVVSENVQVDSVGSGLQTIENQQLIFTHTFIAKWGNTGMRINENNYVDKAEEAIIELVKDAKKDMESDIGIS